jgi:hypothetical protein
MAPRMKSRQWALAVLVSVAGATLGFAGPAVAAGPLAWSGPQRIDLKPLGGLYGLAAHGGLVAVSCSSVSFCAATDYNSVFTSRDPAGGAQAWSATDLSSVLTGGPNTGGELPGLSCPSASLCVAVGGQAVLTSADPTGGASTWNDFAVGNGYLDTVACPSTSLCVAGGQLTVTEDHGQVVVGVIAVSHDPAAGSGAWSTAATRPSVLQCGDSTCMAGVSAISCPSVSLCVAVDAVGDVITGNPMVGSWKTTQVTAPMQGSADGLSGVSCTSVSLCVASPGNVQVFTSTNPTGPRSAWKPYKINITPYGMALHAGNTACGSGAVTLCAIPDAGGIAESSNPLGGGATWTTTDVDKGSSLATGLDAYGLNSVTCPSFRMCVAVDGDGNEFIGVPAVPTARSVRLSLRRQLSPSGKLARIAALVRNRGYARFFTALGAGRLAFSWYYSPRGHGSQTTSQVGIASGAASFAIGGIKNIAIKLTPRGIRLLKRSTRWTLTVKASFTPTGKREITAAKTFRMTTFQ